MIRTIVFWGSMLGSPNFGKLPSSSVCSLSRLVPISVLPTCMLYSSLGKLPYATPCTPHHTLLSPEDNTLNPEPCRFCTCFAMHQGPHYPRIRCSFLQGSLRRLRLKVCPIDLEWNPEKPQGLLHSFIDPLSQGSKMQPFFI